VIVLHVVDARVQRDIQGIVAAFAMAYVLHVPSPRKEVSEPVERHCHDAVSAIECFLNTISMMNVDVDVQHSVVVLQQLKNGENDVVYIAETTCLHLFCMVETASPVDANVSALMIKLDCSVEGTTSRDLGELKETWKAGAVVFTDVKAVGLLLIECVKDGRGSSLQVLDVVMRVERCHLLISRTVRLIH